MLCKVCPGTGWIATLTKANGLEYWRCPCCGGSGTRIVYEPPYIGPGSEKANKEHLEP